MTSSNRPSSQDLSASGQPIQNTSDTLSQLLANSGLPSLNPEQLSSFEKYLSLILRWNTRTNLTAIRDSGGILSRHFLESIACAQALPPGIRTLLDFGSGAGFPGIPIAIVHPEIAITLAESQGKKAAFLQEAVRVLNLQAKVHAGRAEALGSVFDAVTLRAVDKMEEAVEVAARLTAPSGWLVLMTTEADREKLQSMVGTEFQWKEPAAIPGGENRIVLFGQRQHLDAI